VLFAGFVTPFVVDPGPSLVIDTEVGRPELQVFEVEAFLPSPSPALLVQTTCEFVGFWPNVPTTGITLLAACSGRSTVTRAAATTPAASVVCSSARASVPVPGRRTFTIWVVAWLSLIKYTPRIGRYSYIDGETTAVATATEPFSAPTRTPGDDARRPCRGSASDLGVDKAEVTRDLENLVNYSVPMDEAKQSLRRKYGDGGGGGGGGPTSKDIADVSPDDGNVTVTARVLTVGQRSIQYQGDEHVIFEGELADASGKISYTAWEDFGLSPGDTIEAGNAGVREWTAAPNSTSASRRRCRFRTKHSTFPTKSAATANSPTSSPATAASTSRSPSSKWRRRPSTVATARRTSSAASSATRAAGSLHRLGPTP